MRKLIALMLMVGAAFTVPAMAADSDVNGPACLDIIAGAGATYATDGTVTIGIVLAAPACKQFDYGVTVDTAEGEQQLTLLDTNEAGDILIFRGSVDPDTNATISFYATSASPGGRHVFDRAPDTGAPILAKGGSGGLVGFN